MTSWNSIESMRSILRKLWLTWSLVLLACAAAAAVGLSLFASPGAARLVAPELTRTTEVIGKAMAAELERGLGYGIPLPEFVGLEVWLREIVAMNPVLAGVAITDPTGRLLVDHTWPAGLRESLERPGAEPAVPADQQVFAHVLKGGPGTAASRVAGWLYLVAKPPAPRFDPFWVALATGLGVTVLAALSLWLMIARRLREPLAAVHAVFARLAAGELPELTPDAGRNPAARLRTVLARRLLEALERSRQARFRIAEVRAAHFDPRILQSIDALAAPLAQLLPPSRRSGRPLADHGREMPVQQRILVDLVLAFTVLAAVSGGVFTLWLEPYRRVDLQTVEDLLAKSWTAVLDSDARVLEDALNAMLADPALRRQIDKGQYDALPQSFARWSSTGLRMALVQLDGTVLATTAPRAPRFSPDRLALEPLRKSDQTMVGVWQSPDRLYQSGIVRRLSGPGSEFVVLVAARPLEQSLADLQHRLSAPVTLADLRGNPVFEAGAALVAYWQDAGRRSHFSRVEDALMVISATPLKTISGHTIGTLVASQRQSASFSEREMVLLALASLVVALVVIGLPLRLTGSLARVGEAAERLQALAGVSSGDVSGKRRNGLDRTQIDRAVDVLEEKIEALNTLKRSRERQGHRQARYIRYQMLQLANRLDEDARAGILADLERIEQAGRAVAHHCVNGDDHPDWLAPSDAGASRETAPELQDERIVDEVGILALGFQNLVSRVGDQYQQLAKLVEELREALRVKTQFIAIQRELEIAQKIQKSFLPDDFAISPSLELGASMLPAKEVGGDFYDFFRLGEYAVAITVADVSGKGIPAAFFMAVSRTLLRAVAQLGYGPSDSLARLNNLLAADNRETMFVTLFYAVIDTRDGRMTYSNAGHNSPYLLHHDGRLEALRGARAIPLAIMENVPFTETTLQLATGDRLYLYTDGVTEACDPDQQLFGEERLERLLQHLGDAPVSEIPERILAAIKAFENGAGQADDITSLIVRFREAAPI